MNPIKSDEDRSSQKLPENPLRKAQKGGRTWSDGRNQEDLNKFPIHLKPGQRDRYSEKTGRDPSIVVKGTPLDEKNKKLGHHFAVEGLSDDLAKKILKDYPNSYILRIYDGKLELLWFDKKMCSHEITNLDSNELFFNNPLVKNKTLINPEALELCFFTENVAHEELVKQNSPAFAFRLSRTEPGCIFIEWTDYKSVIDDELVVQEPIFLKKVSKEPQFPVLYEHQGGGASSLKDIIDIFSGKSGLLYILPNLKL